MTHADVVNMPVYERKFYVKRLIEQKEHENPKKTGDITDGRPPPPQMTQVPSNVAAHLSGKR